MTLGPSLNPERLRSFPSGNSNASRSSCCASTLFFAEKQRRKISQAQKPTDESRDSTTGPARHIRKRSLWLKANEKKPEDPLAPSAPYRLTPQKKGSVVK